MNKAEPVASLTLTHCDIGAVSDIIVFILLLLFTYLLIDEGTLL